MHGREPTPIFRESDAALVMVTLDDLDGSRIFVVTDGRGNVWRYASVLNAEKKFLEVTFNEN